LFLRVNGYRLTASNAELEAFTLRVTTTKPDLAEMFGWFRANSTLTRRR